MYKIAQLDLGETFLGEDHPLNDLTGVGTLVNTSVSNAIVVAGIILILTIIYAGSSMITASGDPQRFQRSQQILTAAIIGFVIVVAAWFIVIWIETSTGASVTGS